MTTQERRNYEVEAKIQVEDLDAVRVRLETVGGRLVGNWQETDWFFDFDDQRLKGADSALRLRERTDLHTLQSVHRLTFKGPRLPGKFKIRREVEITVDDPGRVKTLLEMLGLVPWISCRKLRSSYLCRDCTVELDRLDELGTFVEIEGPNEEAIDAVISDLGLEGREPILTSYLAMIIQHRKRR